MVLFLIHFSGCIFKCHRMSFRCDRSYTDSTKRIKKKKATINQKSKDDKCFQYALMVALNNRETESHPERVLNIKPFINMTGKK